MDTAEKKLSMFRMIDSLKGKRLEEAYEHMLVFFNSKEEKNTIKVGLENSENERNYTDEEVLNEAREKISKLFK